MTSYSEIVELSLYILRNYELQQLIVSDDMTTLVKIFTPYITFAAGELENSGSTFTITNRNDATGEFGFDLTDGQKVIVAKYCVIGFLTRETNDILQMKLHLQDGDFKTHAEKNNLEGKQNALFNLKEEIIYDVTRLGYKGFKWGDTVV